MTESIQKVAELIQNSDKILIGIGEEFSCEEIELSDSSIYKLYLEKKKAENCSAEVEWLVEYIRNFYINSELDLEKLNIYKAYKKLYEMVKDKDYYIVSMNLDSLLEKSGFDHERIVYPCGNRSHNQCIKNCSNEIWENSDYNNQIIQLILDKDENLNEIERPICKQCKNLVVYNVVGQPNYCEKGYLDKWEQYMQWSARTLNKNLCVLEFGVSFKHPTVIRWPFEKIAFINNKAHFIRVNEKFNQVSEELTNKAVTIKENSIDFLLK